MKKLKGLLVGLSLAAVSVAMSANVAWANNVSQTKKSGVYSVTLKVLPAEAFMGPKAAMQWVGGAKPMDLSAKPKPNHHMVVFLQEKGKPVAKAMVSISYRQLTPKPGRWMSVHVARMSVKGKGPSTTHFGNNLVLATGKYVARVQVNRLHPVYFHFTL